MRARRSFFAVAVLVLALVGVGCAPPPPPEPVEPPEPPPLPAVVVPATVTGGSSTYVLPPDYNCVDEGSTQYLEAAVTIPGSGVVVAWGSASLVQGWVLSEYANPDPIVRVQIPRTVAPGTYLVYLSCYSYLNSYSYAPAKLTVVA